MVLQEYKDYFTDVYETDDLTVAVCNAEAKPCAAVRHAA